MAFRTTPNLGPQIDVYQKGMPYHDLHLGVGRGGSAAVEASYRLGDKELGSDGGEYFFTKASADIAATPTTGTQVAITYPAYTVATGAGGFFTTPGVAIKAGDYLHVRRGAYNAVPA